MNAMEIAVVTVALVAPVTIGLTLAIDFTLHMVRKLSQK